VAKGKADLRSGLKHVCRSFDGAADDNARGFHPLIFLASLY